jgi:hypothetical protein
MLLVMLILCLATLPASAVSDPVVFGNLTGTELCPQDYCGAAWFAASFVGKVGHAHTSGVAFAGITYDFLPSGEEPGHTYDVALTMVMQSGGTGELTFDGTLDHRPLDEGLPPTITGTISQ